MRDVALPFARVGAVENRNEVFVNLQGVKKWWVRVDKFNSDNSTAIGNF
jgi:hypothetical protein